MKKQTSIIHSQASVSVSKQTIHYRLSRVTSRNGKTAYRLEIRLGREYIARTLRQIDEAEMRRFIACW